MRFGIGVPTVGARPLHGFDQWANMTQPEKGAHIARNAPVYRAELANPRLYRDRNGK